MDFLEINIYTNSKAVDILVARLSELGINGFVIHDSADFDEFISNKSANWDYVDDSLMGLKTVSTHITLYLQDNAQGLETFAQLRGALEAFRQEDPALYGSLEIQTGSVREEDWANNWKQYYKPFNVGSRLIIKPSWENVTPEPGRRILEIDPASSFGTGQHQTTRMVMELLEEVITGGERLLDLGTGSGILSIAAMLLGAKNAVMVDVFENAARTAAENMEKNGFTRGSYTAYAGNIIEDTALRQKLGTGYDIITANIVADVIVSMSPLFGGFLAPEGTLIVSGIIDGRTGEVIAALSGNGFTVKEHRRAEDWNAILLKRK